MIVAYTTYLDIYVIRAYLHLVTYTAVWNSGTTLLPIKAMKLVELSEYLYPGIRNVDFLNYGHY